jgi:hypothetical protein
MAAFMLEVDTDAHFVLVDVVVLRVGTCGLRRLMFSKLLLRVLT